MSQTKHLSLLIYSTLNAVNLNTFLKVFIIMTDCYVRCNDKELFLSGLPL